MIRRKLKIFQDMGILRQVWWLIPPMLVTARGSLIAAASRLDYGTRPQQPNFRARLGYACPLQILACL